MEKEVFLPFFCVVVLRSTRLRALRIHQISQQTDRSYGPEEGEKKEEEEEGLAHNTFSDILLYPQGKKEKAKKRKESPSFI